jgi:hypothetical protein
MRAKNEIELNQTFDGGILPPITRCHPSKRSNKRKFSMSHNLRMATAVAMLAFAITGAAHARGANFDRGGFASVFDPPHYRYYGGPKSGPAYFVPGHGILGESCDLPASACSNAGRPN